MRGVQIVELGRPPEPAELEDVQAAQDDLLVEVEAVALNPLDVNVGNGSFYGGHPEVPYVPGCEAAGRAEDGQLVYLFGDGRGVAKPGFAAKRVAVPRDLPVAVPDGVEPVVAAAAGIAGVAAWVSVAWCAEVVPGDRVLVLGGTGAVGRAAVQAAKVRGAERVVAAGRNRRKLERATALGADAAVLIGDTNELADAFGADGYTVCIDPVWGAPLAAALGSATRRARIVHLGQSAGAEAPLRSADVRGKELRILGHSNFALTADERATAYREVLEHVAAGRIVIDVERYPLARVAEAWERQASGPAGKVVVTL